MAQGAPAFSLNGKDDPFSNFKSEPSKPVGKYRPYARRLHFRHLASMRSLRHRGSISGSSQDLLDPAKLMNLQEDARSRKISSEVMKNRLYESVIVSPQRSRTSSSMRTSIVNGDVHTDEVTQFYMHPTRMAMSMPVTPATSNRTTPCGSPTSNRPFMFGFFSRSHTMTLDDDVMDVCDDNRGLASLFSPQPKYVPAANWTPRVEKEQCELSDTDAKIILQDVPKCRQKQRSPSPVDGDL